MSESLAVFLFIIGVFISGLVQIALKRNAGRDLTGLRLLLNPVFLVSNVIYLACFVLTVLLMRTLTLTAATLLQSLSYLFVPLLSRLFLGERVSVRTACGIALILLGLGIYGFWGVN